MRQTLPPLPTHCPPAPCLPLNWWGQANCDGGFVYAAQALLGCLGLGLAAALGQYLRVQSSKLWRCFGRVCCSCCKSYKREKKAEAGPEAGE